MSASLSQDVRQGNLNISVSQKEELSADRRVCLNILQVRLRFYRLLLSSDVVSIRQETNEAKFGVDTADRGGRTGECAAVQGAAGPGNYGSCRWVNRHYLG